MKRLPSSFSYKFMAALYTWKVCCLLFDPNLILLSGNYVYDSNAWFGFTIWVSKKKTNYLFWQGLLQLL